MSLWVLFLFASLAPLFSNKGWNVAMFLQPLGLHDLVGKKDKER